MKSKIENPFFHILFWLVVTTILVLVFGRSWGNSLQAFYFIAMFLPVVMGTSYFFNYYLVPYFLLKKKYFLFGIYFYFMLVISLYLQMLVMFSSSLYLANFNMEEMNLFFIDDIISLAIVMYMVVFMGSFLVMWQQLTNRQREIDTFKTEQQKMEKPFLELMSNRKIVRIPYANIAYIESLADYVKVHSTNGDSTSSKERIGVLEEKLPDSFLRIHRSFIVNKTNIKSFNNNEVEINGVFLNISRSFKKQVQLKLNST